MNISEYLKMGASFCVYIKKCNISTHYLSTQAFMPKIQDIQENHSPSDILISIMHKKLKVFYKNLL